MMTFDELDQIIRYTIEKTLIEIKRKSKRECLYHIEYHTTYTPNEKYARYKMGELLEQTNKVITFGKLDPIIYPIRRISKTINLYPKVRWSLTPIRKMILGWKLNWKSMSYTRKLPISSLEAHEAQLRNNDGEIYRNIIKPLMDDGYHSAFPVLYYPLTILCDIMTLMRKDNSLNYWKYGSKWWYILSEWVNTNSKILC